MSSHPSVRLRRAPECECDATTGVARVLVNRTLIDSTNDGQPESTSNRCKTRPYQISEGTLTIKKALPVGRSVDVRLPRHVSQRPEGIDGRISEKNKSKQHVPPDAPGQEAPQRG